MLRKQTIETPFLPMVLVSDGTHLVKSDFLYDDAAVRRYEGLPVMADPILAKAAQQLDEYFTGKRVEFDLPLLEAGTQFQQKVWQVLKDIPNGQVLTYKEIAERVDSPKAARAVGGACRANPFLVIVPCHRVLGTTGAFTGYAGDKTFVKEALLRLESLV